MENELGRVVYEAFGKATEWRGVLGDPLPKWEALPETLQAAWQAAGDAAVGFALKPLETPQSGRRGRCATL